MVALSKLDRFEPLDDLVRSCRIGNFQRPFAGSIHSPITEMPRERRSDTLKGGQCGLANVEQEVCAIDDIGEQIAPGTIVQPNCGDGASVWRCSKPEAFCFAHRSIGCLSVSVVQAAQMLVTPIFVDMRNFQINRGQFACG